MNSIEMAIETLKRTRIDSYSLPKAIGTIKEQVAHSPPFIFLTCLRKCASTFLLHSLLELTGYERLQPVYGHKRNEQDLYLPQLLLALGGRYGSRTHTRASNHNLELIQLFQIKPIVLVRNIFDIVPSIRDHLNNISLPVPEAFVTEHFFELTEDQQIDFVIDVALPWYFNFYVSWYACEQQGLCDIHWLTYEEMMSDQKKSVGSVLDFVGVAYDKSKIDLAIASATKKPINFNKGISGRGEQLSKDQRDRIYRLASYYKWVDFNRIGLET